MSLFQNVHDYENGQVFQVEYFEKYLSRVDLWSNRWCDGVQYFQHDLIVRYDDYRRYVDDKLEFEEQ